MIYAEFKLVFNLPGQKKGVKCFDHKELGMIDVRNSKCINCGVKQRNFGFETDMKATHCAGCKLDGMIDVKHSKCINCGVKHRNFGFETDMKATHCSGCKLDGMIDVKHHMCVNCQTRANYGYPSNFPTTCSRHKLDGMIYNPRKICAKTNCSRPALYGIKTPIHCELHKNNNDINLVERKCIKCSAIDIVNNEGICINSCLINSGYELYQKNRKHKEERILKVLTEEFGLPTSYDKIIDSSCNTKRPDIVYDFKDRCIVIEIDERQHKSYTQECDTIRTQAIYHTLGFQKTFFLRYNPDNFKVANKQANISPEKRESTLIKWIYYLKNKNIFELPFLGVMYLFFDNYLQTDTKYFKLSTDPHGKNSETIIEASF